MALEAAVRDAYQQLLDHVPAEHPFVVRCWHYLPAITQPMDAKRDRYMAFNAGRFAAFEAWFGGELRQARHLPAASAVGLDRDDLWIDLLAVRSAGCAVENPRQIPAVRYSAAYGPRPPCFSRACRIDGDLLGRPVLLIAGTASIRGEATIHPHQLSGQLEELVLNFRSLLATEKAGPMLELRAYYREPSDRQAIAAAMKQAFGERVPVQFVRADLCRADLQVEVEAVASLATEAG